jgi:hypothetical protein
VRASSTRKAPAGPFEIFEDAEQNFYAKTAADFTPMIFFDPDGFWEHDAEFDKHGVTSPGVNVRDLIQKVFRHGRTDSVAVLNKVRFTVDFDEIDAVLTLRSHSKAWRSRWSRFEQKR